MNNRPRSPLMATVNVTSECNLDCGYCFYEPKRAGSMPFTAFRRTVEELRGEDVFLLIISGGEPMVHPKIEAILRCAHKEFRNVLTLTNGTLMPRGAAKAIEDISAEKGGFPVQISLDSIDPEANAKTRCENAAILENIERYYNMGANIIISAVITRFNVDTIPRTIDELSRYTSSFHLMEMQQVEKNRRTYDGMAVSDDDLHMLKERISKIQKERHLQIDMGIDEEIGPRGCASGAPCMACFTHLTIEPNLDVLPCDYCRGFVIGNLKGQSLHAIWNGARARTVTDGVIPLCVRDDYQARCS